MFIGLTYFLVWYLSQGYFSRHIVHKAPLLFWILLLLFALLFSYKLTRFKLYIPFKNILSIVPAFIVSVLIVLLVVEPLDHLFNSSLLFLLLISPLAGFAVMKLHLILPMIILVYVITIFFLRYRVGKSHLN